MSLYEKLLEAEVEILKNAENNNQLWDYIMMKNGYLKLTHDQMGNPVKNFSMLFLGIYEYSKTNKNIGIEIEHEIENNIRNIQSADDFDHLLTIIGGNEYNCHMKNYVSIANYPKIRNDIIAFYNRFKCNNNIDFDFRMKKLEEKMR